MAFFYHYTVKLDDKGRITIPSDYKSSMEEDYKSDNLAVVHGVAQQNCLVVYPLQVWIEKMNKLIKSPDMAKQNVRKIVNFRRYLNINTYQKKLDKTGKLLIPARLWEKIGLTKVSGGLEMVISGNFDCFEIWMQGSWEEYINQGAGLFSEAASLDGESLDPMLEANFYLDGYENKNNQ